MADKFFKDANGAPYVIEAGFEHFLPNGLTEINETEFKAIQVAMNTPTTEQLTDAARAERNALIAATDYLVMADYPIAAADLDKVKVYRQALRDVTKQTKFPATIKWPVYPL